jgi:hypothetical protein
VGGAQALVVADDVSARRSLGSLWSSRLTVALVPIGGVALVATRYRRNWYFYDEWSMIQRVLVSSSPIRSAFESYNGHLYLFAFMVYRVQLALGLNGHAFVWAIFCLTLIASNVAVALTLRTAGVPAFASVVGGAVITYFGPGAQLMTLEFQFGMVGAIAMSFFAAHVVLRQRSSFRAAVAVSSFLLVATTFDSGTATAGVVFVAVLLALRWHDRWAVVALGPSVAAGATFLLASGPLPRWPAGIGAQARFAVHLVALAAGGLVGGRQIAGGIVLGVACIVFIPAIATGRMSREAGHCLAAGLTAALVMTAIIANTRAGLVRNDFLEYNRYVALVAVYLFVSLLPAAVVIVRGVVDRRSVWIGPATATLLVVVFVLNYAPLTRYRRLVEGWQTTAHLLTAQASEQLALGCPNGKPPADDTMPLGALSPQLTVGFLEQLEDRGSLRFAPVPVSAPVRRATCPR